MARMLLGKRDREELGLEALSLDEQLAEACAGGGIGGLPGTTSAPADEREIRRLVGAGASINRSKALHMAAANDQPAAIKLLVQLGGRVDDVDHMGNTALHVASGMKQTRCMQVLIANGAAVLKNGRGHTPRETARRGKASDDGFMASVGLAGQRTASESAQWDAVQALLGGGKGGDKGGGRGDTKLVTLSMLRNGESIGEIAAARSLTASTIESHVAELYKTGEFPEAPKLLGLTSAIRDEIRGINSRLPLQDAGKLKPIKDRCAYSYGVIKLALV